MKKEKSIMGKAMAMAGTITEDIQGILLDDLGAEVLVTGTARTTDQSQAIKDLSENMKSKSAIVNLKAVDVYTGRILASTSANQPGMHIDSDTASKIALQRCLQSVLGKNDESGKFVSGPFMHQITKKFLQSATRRMIMINIAGLNYEDLTKFRNQIEQRVRGINKIYSRGQSGQYSKIEVEFAGKTTDLADELNAKANNLGFQIEIKETYPNRIMMTASRL